MSVELEQYPDEVRWLTSAPSTEKMQELSVIMALRSRGAYSDGTCVSEEELTEVMKHVGRVMWDVAMLSLLLRGHMVVHAGPNGVEWSLSELGKQKAEELVAKRG